MYRPVWVSEAYQLFLVPSQSSNMPLYPSKCCELGSMPRLFPLSLFFTWTHIWILQGVGSASSPILELQHALLLLKVLWVRECASTPPPFTVFYLDSHLNPSRIGSASSPIPELQHALLLLKMLWVRVRAPTPPPLAILCLDSLLNPSKSWECVILGLPGEKNHLDVGPMERCKVYYKGEGGGFPQVRVVMSLVCLCYPWFVLTPKVLQLCISHLVWVLCRLVWVSEACQLFLVPSRSSNMPLYPSKCCELRSAPWLLLLLLSST